MQELYFITRLDAIYTAFFIIAVLCSIATIVIMMATMCFGEDDEIVAYSKTIRKPVAILALVGILGVIFVPTTKEALVIYGVGGTIDYVKQDTVVQKLPQKAAIALDKYLKSINNNDK